LRVAFADWLSDREFVSMDHGIVLKAKTEGLFSFETFIASGLAFHLDQALSGIVRASGWCEKTPAAY
jgi:hypothetical protein